MIEGAEHLDPLVDELCRRVGDDADDDLTALLEREARRLAPLLDRRRLDIVVRRSQARLDGLDELADWLADETVDEVLVNSGGQVWVERRGRLEHVASLAEGRLPHLIERVLAPIGRRLDRMQPIVDARLPDGSRVCAVVPPIAVGGAHLSIRRFSERARGIDEFTDAAGTELFADLVDRRVNAVVSGRTSAGKSSLLAAVLALVAPDERLVVLEDTAELVLANAHVVRLEGRPAAPDGVSAVGLADLLRAALRLRPDRLVVGEVRGDEVLGLVQAMNTGHDGSWSTVHANSPVDAIARLESLIVQSAPSWPLTAIRAQLHRSIDVIVQVERLRDGRRVVAEVGEVPPEPGGTFVTLARRDPSGALVCGPCPTRSRGVPR